jgi:hypothetical protein
VDDERYRHTLYSGERPIMHGWWSDRPTAERKFLGWIGEHGSVDGARVELVDEEEQRVIASWPDEAPRLRD